MNLQRALDKTQHTVITESNSSSINLQSDDINVSEFQVNKEKKK